MSRTIRIAFSIDHQKKKTRSVSLAQEVYLHLVTSDAFVAVLPVELKTKFEGAQKKFGAENKFFSDEYRKEYARDPYVRLIFGPDIHRFFARVLSLNYQSFKALLDVSPGSFEEYFADWNEFWNPKYLVDGEGDRTHNPRDLVFCYACLMSQFKRLDDKAHLSARLDAFAQSELAQKDARIDQLENELEALQQENRQQQARIQDLENELAVMGGRNLVLVPSDPHHMLGLRPERGPDVEDRAKILMKALHPDKSGSPETAYLFDMIVKARDMILKDKA